MPSEYKTPEAFRQALESRLRIRAEKEGLDLQWLRRQVAFERLLARVFRQPDAVWLLKGGYAMELRLQQRARTTLDVDLMVVDVKELRLVAGAKQNEQTSDVAYDYLRQLADNDLDDFFQYVIAKPRSITTTPGGGMRCSVDSRIGGKTFANFHVDIGLGDIVVGEPEWVSGRGLLEFAGVAPIRIQLLPSAQQIAEKFHAYTYQWDDRVNTRVKDLVDLVLLFETQELDRDEVRRAVVATFSHRDTHPLPVHLPPPPGEWAEAFVALADELDLSERTLDDAFAYIYDRWNNWELGSRGS
jgi:hypothetical protein